MGLVYSEPACQAAYDGNLLQLRSCLHGDPAKLNVQEGSTRDTPLIAACRRGNLQAIRYLLGENVDVNLRNKKQRTCLHYVSRRTLSLLDYLTIIILMPVLLIGLFILMQKRKRDVALMEALLRTAVDVDAADYKGNTALHYACLRRSHRLVPLLLQRGARTAIRNQVGETPLDIATRTANAKIIRLLQKAE